MGWIYVLGFIIFFPVFLLAAVVIYEVIDSFFELLVIFFDLETKFWLWVILFIMLLFAKPFISMML